MIKIYFAGSIRGGRENIDLYNKTINYLQQLGKVLTEHIGNDEITKFGEIKNSDKRIYKRDLQWLKSADVIIADVSNPSLGVGFEIAKAIEFNKKVLCLYKIQNDKRLSAMIAGCPNVRVKEYTTFDDVEKTINEFLKFSCDI